MIELNSPVFVLTSDVDWGKEEWIDDLADIASSFDIKPTFFATHDSASLRKLRADERIHIGVHPNFLPGSSHGDDVNTVIDHVLRWFPETNCFRAHSFVDSTLIALKFREHGMQYDSNLCLYLQENIPALNHASGLMRFPVFWEDDIHMLWNGAWDFDQLEQKFLTPGLKVLNFHPIHVALNTPDDAYYQSVKNQALNQNNEENENLRFSGKGTRTFLLELLERLTELDIRFYALDELYQLLSDKPDSDEFVLGRSGRTTDADYGGYRAASPTERQNILKDHYNKRSPTDIYATSRDYNLRELEIAAIKQCIVQKGCMLDLGCGNGYTLLSLAKELKDFELTGVDFADELVAGAKSLLELNQDSLQSHPEFHCADAVKYIEQVPDHSLDYILTERFLLNMPDESTQHAVVREIYRALSPGGRFIMCEASNNGFRALNELRAKLGLEIILETSADNISALRFDDEAVEKFLIEDLGFDLANKLGVSTYFTISRALHPALIAPLPPRFGAKINSLAKDIQLQLPFDHGIGSNVIWVLDKPAA
jgi:ubiquinone/menaquinone biosynthesis C-methylase UbiE